MLNNFEHLTFIQLKRLKYNCIRHTTETSSPPLRRMEAETTALQSTTTPSVVSAWTGRRRTRTSSSFATCATWRCIRCVNCVCVWFGLSWLNFLTAENIRPCMKLSLELGACGQGQKVTSRPICNIDNLLKYLKNQRPNRKKTYVESKSL